MNSKWENKLIALLHDPPEKPYDYGIEHIKSSERYAAALGLDPKAWESKEPDWAAAAADRFVFPSSKAGGLGGGVTFQHPLSGKKVFSTSKEDFQKEHARTTEAVVNSLPSYDIDASDVSAQARFYAAWRYWRENVGDQEAKTVYLPADTRIPDHSIWHHCGIVSALEATRSASGTLKPAFLMMQAGPVQDFISQARTTRDLWSGSMLLSWLMSKVLCHLASEVGPDCVIYPSLRCQPLFDWGARELLQQAKFKSGDKESKNQWELHLNAKNLTIPSLPNKFLAIVPEDYDPTGLTKVWEEEWGRIAASVRKHLDDNNMGLAESMQARWDYQIEHHWNLTWCIHPLQSVDEAVATMAQRGINNQQLTALKELALGIPKEEKDKRCYRDGSMHKAWAWSGHYALVAHQLAARRRTREFDGWHDPAWEAGNHDRQSEKDSLSGNAETVLSRPWLEEVGRSGLQHDFRRPQPLGAVNVVKRLWHKTYLKPEFKDLKQNAPRSEFPSVPSIAANPFKSALLRAVEEQPDVWDQFVDLPPLVEEVANAVGLEKLSADQKETDWIEKAEAKVFTTEFWQGELERLKEANSNAKNGKTENPENTIKPIEQIIKLVGKLRSEMEKATGRALPPSSYYAVVAMDGDSIGKWISGENCPKLDDVLSPEAAKYFSPKIAEYFRKLKENSPEKEAALRRPMSPAFHLQFSEALANFSVIAVNRICEHFEGQLVYAGGDDVLALLPASRALAFAQAIRKAYQGDASLPEVCDKFTSEGTPDGFIRLKKPEPGKPPEPGLPTYPLLVPGPKATISAGIAIGHVHSPLQDLIGEANAMLKLAKSKPSDAAAGHEADKDFDVSEARDGIAVSAVKRSGEILRWRCRFGQPSAALALLNLLQSDSTAETLAARENLSLGFAHRVADLLRAYGENLRFSSNANPNNLRELVQREVDWALEQLDTKGSADMEKLIERCQTHIHAYLDELETIGGSVSALPRLLLLNSFLSRHDDT